MKNENLHTTLYAAVLVIAAGLAGCASPAKKESMRVEGIQGIQQYQSTVSVLTQGGSETSAMGASSVSNEAFAKAIEESIIENGLFTQVINNGGSEYLLSVNIVSMNKPMFGGSFTVDMEAAWSLVEAASKKAMMRKSIKSSHTTTMGDAFAGVTRLRLAVEGAAKENIRLGLLAISKLDLEK